MEGLRQLKNPMTSEIEPMTLVKSNNAGTGIIKSAYNGTLSDRSFFPLQAGFHLTQVLSQLVSHVFMILRSKSTIDIKVDTQKGGRGG
jgi:hypothetical protein